MSWLYTLTPQAEAELLSIWQYIAEDDSDSAADRVINRIYAECQKLAEMPGMGHYRHELADERFKFWSVWSYLIVYQWQASPMKVVAIVHGARDLDDFFGGRLDQ